MKLKLFGQSNATGRAPSCIRGCILRSDYKKAVRGEIDSPSSIRDLRLLNLLRTASGPQDHALGTGALGDLESVSGRWRWAFQGISTSITGEFHDTKDAAIADLEMIQSMLFPPDLPTADCFDPARRLTHLQRAQKSTEMERAHDRRAFAE